MDRGGTALGTISSGGTTIYEYYADAFTNRYLHVTTTSSGGAAAVSASSVGTRRTITA